MTVVTNLKAQGISADTVQEKVELYLVRNNFNVKQILSISGKINNIFSRAKSRQSRLQTKAVMKVTSFLPGSKGAQFCDHVRSLQGADGAVQLAKIQQDLTTRIAALKDELKASEEMELVKHYS